MGPLTFSVCIKRAQEYVNETDVAKTYKLAAEFFEREIQAKSMETEIRQRDEQIALLQRLLDAKQRLADERERLWLKAEAQWNIVQSSLIKDNLRVKGMFSSRGAFERVLLFIHLENLPTKPFIATNTAKSLGSYKPGIFLSCWRVIFADGMVCSSGPNTNSWTAKLSSTVSDCLTAESRAADAQDISDYASQLYGTLSLSMHGSPWETDIIEFSEELSKLDRCVLERICKEMLIL